MTDRTAPHKPQEPLRHAYYLVNGDEGRARLLPQHRAAFYQLLRKTPAFMPGDIRREFEPSQ